MDLLEVRRRRGRRIVIAVVVVLLLIGGGVLGAGWYYSGQLLDPSNERPGHPDTVLGIGRSADKPTVVLAESASTVMPGRWGLVWNGGAAQVGGVVGHKDGKVQRELLAGSAPAPDTAVRLEAAMWTGDPRSAHGLEFSDVMIPTELGDAAAWYVPAASANPTWAITVHGRGGTRAEALRVIPRLHNSGLPVLAVTYRNDAGAPSSPDGLYHLGDTEWRDVEAAVRYARSQGAEHVVLHGWSMGGAIVEQMLARSPLAGSVSGVVLDAPVTSWNETLNLQAHNRGLPSALTPIAEAVSGWRADLDFTRFDLIEHPPATKPPTLLFHGSADSTVPVQASRDLAIAAHRLNWPLQYVEVPGAEHTAEWNVGPAGYERNLDDFIARIVGSQAGTP